VLTACSRYRTCYRTSAATPAGPPQPENFLLTERGPSGIIKATDFGLSRFFKEGQPLDEIVGSPFYVSTLNGRAYGLSSCAIYALRISAHRSRPRC
jgi:serine/threonine protein kinase